ncbi:CTC-interacting domain 10 [Euphorbia peplus]|nr:CTC-interacting domain 10 [Euphorbia peplus]
MAVAENAAPKNGTSVSSDSNDLDTSKPRNENDDQNSATGNFDHQENGQMVGYGTNQNQIDRPKSNGLNDMSDLADILSKLNPMAEEFVPPSLAATNHAYLGNLFGYTNNSGLQSPFGNANGNNTKRKKNNFSQGRRRMNTRTSMAQREDVIKRTVYVSDIDQQVTEEQLAGLFIHCGQVVDCRICGDPNSVLRFAFIEFTDEEGARAALSLSGTVLGYYPLRVLPSKTAIAPVNPTFLPRSEDEREMCARTIYCTNIDKKITQADVRLFFESFCGEVHRLRLLGDYHHSTRIAFVEFAVAESAILALNCSGAVLGALPIRVSPSKTPVRPRIPRSPMH